MSEHTSILGAWTICEALIAGRPSEYMVGTGVVFDKDVFWRQIDGVNTEPCRYDVEYDNKPFQINFYYEDGVNRGILEFRSGELVICETETGRVRSA